MTSNESSIPEYFEVYVYERRKICSRARVVLMDFKVLLGDTWVYQTKTFAFYVHTEVCVKWFRDE